MSVLYVRSQANLRRATTAEQAATENFNLARSAVDQYLTRVADSQELKAHGLEDLRKQLLDTAREFYETFAQTQADSPEMRAGLGDTWQRLGAISRVVGDSSRAEEAFKSAMATFEALESRSPDDPAAQAQLSGAISDLALVQYDTGRLSEAEENFRRAVAIDADIARAHPGDADRDTQRANTLDEYAQLERLKRPDESERTYLQALDIRKAVRAAHPDSGPYLLQLLHSHVNIGALYGRTRRLPDADRVLREAVPLGAELTSRWPHVDEYDNAAATIWGNLGGVNMLLEHYDRSADDYRQELASRERLVADHPNVLDYRLFLGGAHTNIGELQVRQGNFAAGLPSLDRALETFQWILAREPQHRVATT